MGYSMIEEERINWVNGIYEDGEWTDWYDVGQQIDDDDAWDSEDQTSCLESKTNPSTLELWELLSELIESARTYLNITGRHLPIYGELGELYGEIKYGIKRHKPNTAGSDGKMGNDFVEIKTISPHKSNNVVSVKLDGNFNKLLIVKISEDFTIKSKMLDRKNLNKGLGKYAKAIWKD